MTNFHQSPFDESTKTKLALFEAYAKEWLPVFLNKAARDTTVTIADFFAGPGRDKNNCEGTPLIFLNQIRDYSELIRDHNISVNLELNEFAKRKATCLREVLEEENVSDELCKWNVTSEEFSARFDQLYPSLRASSNLLFFDQQGMKQISDEVFRKVLFLRRTDFMFFVASSSVRRFWDHENFQRHLGMTGEEFLNSSFSETHRAVTDYYRKLVPTGKSYFLAPFSIKKGSNIYGVIFGSAHPKGIGKFLNICWKLDQIHGEANFDISGESIDSRTPRLFPEMDTTSKIQKFQAEIRTNISRGELNTDGELYIACLANGMLPKHGKDVLREMLKSGDIRMVGGAQPRVSYDGWKQPRALEVPRDDTI